MSATTGAHRRSSFGEFVYSQNQMVRVGLIGGELTTAWALLHLDESKAKVRSALSRAIHKSGLNVATASDDEFLYVWNEEAK